MRLSLWHDPPSVRTSLSLHKRSLVMAYGQIAECYDSLMRAGYYDHVAMAQSACELLGDCHNVVELGVGTGLFAKAFLELEPGCEFLGVDLSQAMLHIAEDRIGDRMELAEGDVQVCELDGTFDGAVSCGGVWVVIRDGDDLLLGTHLRRYEDDLAGLRNVAEHLVPGGRLLLSTQQMHQDFELALDDGLVYSQKVTPPLEDGDHFFIDKEYCFRDGEEIIAQEKLRLGFYRKPLMDRLLAEGGFVFEREDDRGFFSVYRRR